MESTYLYCEQLVDVSKLKIPKTVKSARWVFSTCTGLTSIILPDSIIGIWPRSFEGCRALNNVIYKGTREQWKVINTSTDRNKYLLNATVTYAGE